MTASGWLEIKTAATNTIRTCVAGSNQPIKAAAA